MKKGTFLLVLLFVCRSFIFCQVKKDSLDNHIYPPQSYGNFSPKESWEIHRAAYIKQLKAEGLTDDEFERRLLIYEEQKDVFLAEVKEQNKIAAIQRAKANEQRKLAEIERKRAEKERKEAQEWRGNAKNILIKNVTISNNNEPVMFKVTSKKTLRIGIRAHISSGIASIEIYNPKGIKEGELSLKFEQKSDLNEEEGKEYISGALDKTILETEVGEWQIKILSQKSEGNVSISVAQDL